MSILNIVAVMNIGYVSAQKMIIAPDVLDMSTLNAARSYFTVRLDSAPDADMVVNFTSNAVQFSNCESTVFSIDNWQLDQKIYIDRQSVFSSLSVDMSTAQILAELINTENKNIVQNKTISLKNIKPNQGANCYSTGDPHFVTFNNQRFDYQSYHTVWLLQSPFLSVQCLQMPCNNYVTCNIACSIQVSDGINSAYFLTSANGTTAKLTTTKVSDDNNFLNTYLYHQIINDQNWKFIFKDGSQVNLIGRTWPTADQGYLDVFIFVPTRYKYLTSGLCGMWEDTSSTLMMPNGTSLDFKDKSKSASNVLLFANSWTIQNSSVAYNQIYNVINGTSPKPISLTDMYKFQPYVNSIIEQKCGSDLQTIIKTWSSNTFKQCMKPLKVLPTLVKPPTGLLNSKPFSINWNAIQRYTKWGRFTPLITDPNRYYPGYKYRGNFLRKRQNLNTTELIDTTVTSTLTLTNIVTSTRIETTIATNIVKQDIEPEVSSQDLIFITEQCKMSMVAENCQQIVSNEHLNHIENCIEDVKHVWFMKSDRDISISSTLNNHKQAFLEHCKQATENFLAILPMQIVKKLDDVLSQSTNTLTKRNIDILSQIQSILGKDSNIMTVVKAQIKNGLGSFQNMQNCLNGGIPLESGGCQCIDMHSGFNCEHKIILVNNTNDISSTTPSTSITKTTTYSSKTTTYSSKTTTYSSKTTTYSSKTTTYSTETTSYTSKIYNEESSSIISTSKSNIDTSNGSKQLLNMILSLSCLFFYIL
jgi:hypothetical protein